MFQSAQEPLDLMQRFMRADCRVTPDYGIVLVESRRSPVAFFHPFFCSCTTIHVQAMNFARSILEIFSWLS
jgi:hypothetical protein